MRIKAAAICVTCCALFSAPAAQAHISLHPNTIPAGAFVTLDVRVPGEQAGAYTYKVDMLIPPGFTEIDTQDVPGWSVKEVMSKLAKPIQTDDGPIGEKVSQIIWTGDRSRLGRLKSGQFIEFPLSIAMPSDIAGQTLAFRTIQYCSNGKTIHWIGSPSAEYPAPTINVTAKGGVIEDVAGGEAGPIPGEAPSGQSAPASTPALSVVKSGGSASQGLGIAALILGALGLLAGIVGLTVARRSRAALGDRTVIGR